mgnify:CR=1 FL=1
MVAQAPAEVVSAIKGAGGLAGLHICANGDWGPALQGLAALEWEWMQNFYTDLHIFYFREWVDNFRLLTAGISFRWHF